MHMPLPAKPLLTALALIGPGGIGVAMADEVQNGPYTDQQLTFFETNIRPVLADNCYSCHSHESEKLKAGLYLDSRAGFIDSLVAEPGKPDESLFIEAVRWEVRHTEMPPTHKLADAEIADLVRWVEMGLPWPEEAAPGDGQAAEAEVFDLPARRASHWSWQTPHRALDLPEAAAESTSATIDHLISVRLAEQGLSLSPEADRATLIRRVTFDLTGLPPTPAEIDAFINDPSPDAYENLVDRLLASPRFGETWARHHLDLVRYAETLGHEFDFNIHEPWRYRDYVIRALNDDIPYDQFVREHIAGDLLENPRIDPETGENQSILATGFYWLGEQTHSPVDVKAHQADRIDNQIDVLTKTFQGMTVSCARCHDHKFDAISTADYYALYGIIQSTQWSLAELEQPAEPTESTRELQTLRGAIEPALRQHWDPSAERIGAYLLAATGVIQTTQDVKDDQARRQQITAQSQIIAEQQGLDANLLQGWIALLTDRVVQDKQHPLYIWHVIRTAKPDEVRRRWAQQQRAALRAVAQAETEARPDDIELLNVTDPTTYTTLGNGFTPQAIPPSQLLASTGWRQAAGELTVMPALSTASVSSRQQGAVRTPTRKIDRRYVHVLAQGNGSRINFVVDGFRLIRNPIYGQLRQQIDHNYPRWYTVDLDRWRGHDLYVEIADYIGSDPATGGSPPDATATVYRVIASDQPQPAFNPATALLATMPGDAEPDLEQLAQAYQEQFIKAAASWQIGESLDGPRTFARNAWVGMMLDSGLLELPTRDDQPTSIHQTIQAFREADLKEPLTALAVAATDGTGMDSPVFKRGSPHAPGDPVTRGFLTALTDDPATRDAPSGSGRLELAAAINDPDNPLTARLQVNRLWHHLFGRGLVASVDNLGLLGTPPTHPELLDHLAVSFIEDDYQSSKAMIRHILMSKTYRQSSDRTDDQAEELDPLNLLLRRQNLRRIPAEAIRDSILAVSGELDEKMFGPPIAPHLTEFMSGRGRPRSGPLDGAGRRSIYIGVRRNFLSPMMLTFDAPIPFSTVGARNTTNVPAQALILMNDPFVHNQAQKWAQRLVTQDAADPQARIEAMFFTVFGRPATQAERDAALAYFARQTDSLGLSDAQQLTDPRPWRDLAHVMFNLKGFIYIR